MKKLIYPVILILLAAGSLSAQQEKKNTDEISSVKKVVKEAYIDGLLKAKDFDAARKGIHKDFSMLGIKDINLTKFSRDNWIKMKNEKKRNLEFEHKFENVDVTGRAAVVKVRFFTKTGKYTDYLFLYKFKDGWKIVTGIDHSHGNN